MLLDFSRPLLRNISRCSCWPSSEIIWILNRLSLLEFFVSPLLFPQHLSWVCRRLLGLSYDSSFWSLDQRCVGATKTKTEMSKNENKNYGWWRDRFTYDFPLLFTDFSISKSIHEIFSTPSLVICHFLHSLMVVIVSTFNFDWLIEPRCIRKVHLRSCVFICVKIVDDVANLHLIELSLDIFGFILILNRIFFSRRSLFKTNGSSWTRILIRLMHIQFANIVLNYIFSVDNRANVFVGLEFDPIFVIASLGKDIFQ